MTDRGRGPVQHRVPAVPLSALSSEAAPGGAVEGAGQGPVATALDPGDGPAVEDQVVTAMSLRTVFVVWPVRAWRWARQWTGPVAAVSLMARCVVTVWVLLTADPYR